MHIEEARVPPNDMDIDFNISRKQAAGNCWFCHTAKLHQEHLPTGWRTGLITYIMFAEALHDQVEDKAKYQGLQVNFAYLVTL